ncbi:MAG: hypothetical protein LC776_08725 [Acidobacteria bacterium]|nr:hypothetical protein [Acidobacteriota bacterium]
MARLTASSVQAQKGQMVGAHLYIAYMVVVRVVLSPVFMSGYSSVAEQP